MRSYFSILGLFLLVVFTSSSHAVTVYVPDHFTTIQAGIDACADGDTVMVRDGTYTGDGNRDIDFWGKAIVLMSENGPEVTIIDCQGSRSELHRGFFFHSGEDANTVVQGFTIMNGYQSYSGGGVICGASSPTIAGNIITGNTANNIGGGITVEVNSSPMITGNTITGNEVLATDGVGGGICSYDNSTPTITNNTISQNTADWGGGIYCIENPSATITDNEISDNVAISGTGGGLMTNFTNAEIRRNTITGNVINDGGGAGLICWNGTSIIENNVISGNTASNRGGGIFLLNENSSLSNNLITNNTANMDGGGIRARHSFVTMSNNTIAENTALGSGGGMWIVDDSEVNIVNTISWNNTATAGEEIAITYQIAPPEPSTLTISYSDVDGGEEGVFVDSGCTLNWGLGMIDENPLFVSFHGLDYLLRRGSLCIDAGDPTIDDGRTWPVWYNNGLRSDMGAYGGPGNLGWLP